MLGNDDHQTRRLCFSIFEIDLDASELRKHRRKIRIQEQPFQLLAILIEYAGEVVSREDLQKKLWTADTFVNFDHGLNKPSTKSVKLWATPATAPDLWKLSLIRRQNHLIAQISPARP
jgi:Transcriptional regulatory protein, C terminal